MRCCNLNKNEDENSGKNAEPQETNNDHYHYQCNGSQPKGILVEICVIAHMCWVRCFYIVGQIVSHSSVCHIVFFYVLIKTMMCSCKTKTIETEFISSNKVDPGAELKALANCY